MNYRESLSFWEGSLFTIAISVIKRHPVHAFIIDIEEQLTWKPGLRAQHSSLNCPCAGFRQAKNIDYSLVTDNMELMWKGYHITTNDYLLMDNLFLLIHP